LKGVPLRTRREIARILQEALVNIRKHSSARRVLVRTDAGNGLWRLTIEDDGRGFPFAGRRSQVELDALRQGPRTIRERARMFCGGGEARRIRARNGRQRREHHSSGFALRPESARVTRAVRIVVADDHEIFRDGLRRLVESEPNLEVVGEAPDASGAVTLTRELNPDILLLDVAMPRASGVDALRELADTLGETRVILLTAAIDRADL